MIHNIEDEAWITRPNLAAATEAVIDAGLCFDALVRPQHLPYLLEFLQRHPELKTVIDHGAKPVITEGLWQPWADRMSEIAESTDAYCKLSGLLTEAGPDQGLRRPPALHGAPARHVRTGAPDVGQRLAGAPAGRRLPRLVCDRRTLPGQRLDEADRAQVLGATAARFYGV